MILSLPSFFSFFFPPQQSMATSTYVSDYDRYRYIASLVFLCFYSVLGRFSHSSSSSSFYGRSLLVLFFSAFFSSFLFSSNFTLLPPFFFLFPTANICTNTIFLSFFLSLSLSLPPSILFCHFPPLHHRCLHFIRPIAGILQLHKRRNTVGKIAQL